MPTVKVRSTVNVLGLKAGQEAEIDLTSHVVGLLRAGYLLLLRPKANGENVSVRNQSHLEDAGW